MAASSLLPNSHRLQHLIGWRHAAPPDTAATGLATLDLEIGGCPRGRITELTGPASSGRATLLHSTLAAAGTRGEFVALIDVQNSFDPLTAATAGIRLDRFLWVRCGGDLEHGLQSADLLLQSGGFGMIALDCCGVSERALSRIPVSYWFRFRRAIEPTQVCLMIAADRPLAKSCSSLWIESRRTASAFQSAMVMAQSRYQYVPRKPVASAISLTASASIVK